MEKQKPALELEEQDKEQNPIIQLKGLGKQFKTSNGPVTALDDIHLEINPGEIFGIIGLSGAGKSTLVRCINYLEVPTSGTVIFEGVSLAGKDDKPSLAEKLFRFLSGGSDQAKKNSEDIRRARRSMGMIFQQFNLLAQRNVLQNVCFPLELIGTNRKEAQKRAEKLLKMVGLEDRMKAYPAQLSGGQKQRVAIARALATNPKILLCDEATSALDPTTTKSILALLKEINERYGITIVIITHEMAVVQEICTHVAIIDGGALAETGTVEEVFARPKTAAAKRLVFQNGGNYQEMKGKRCIRIVFKENSSFEPVIANMVLECKTPANILLADTKDIGGVAHGQMILQLPEDEVVAGKMISYLKERKLEVEELDNYVG